jgi:hypothetical protein
MFGRESAGSRVRAERFQAWRRARSGYAVISGLIGLLSLIDAVMVVPGVAAIVTGVLGLRDLRAHPELKGRRLCIAGIVCGVISLVLAAVLYSSHLWIGNDGESSTTAVSDGAVAGDER